ncbi:2' O-ribose methyltransferase [Orbilia oligospora]|nr:2' O-ribose methyltransferase [Orbilia oligospora]KAF3186586.1 2' O-ribose methyltransferase [Orbilia oligospora]KAF3266067.1 2' O-ribose methyltransferase, variant 2 [Orbilia oligospora]KAF3296739.1 2' O-ribose methyltransferase [Orbilia oligospora]
MAIPRSYFRSLVGLALESPYTIHNAPRQRKIALSTLCIFRRLTPTSISSSRSFSTTPFALASKSSRWVKRQSIDYASREAKVLQYKSRAALKLLEIDQDHKIFSPGMTVVDLGFAPGSWSQVAVHQTHPNGRVVGIDLLPAQPPKGVSSIQGNFLSPGIQASIRRYLSDPNRGRARLSQSIEKPKIPCLEQYMQSTTTTEQREIKIKAPILQLDDTASSGYIAQERRDSLHDEEEEAQAAAEAAVGPTRNKGPSKVKDRSKMTQEEREMNTVDVVLSDMLMNTSGVAVRDHAGSMELCTAALTFCVDVLKPGGSFVCKFYQGEDDGRLEQMLDRVFNKVTRMKPDASRPESKECYFVATKKKSGVTREAIGVPGLNA